MLVESTHTNSCMLILAAPPSLVPLNRAEIHVCDHEGNRVCNLESVDTVSLAPTGQVTTINIPAQRNHNLNYIVLLDPEHVRDEQLLDRVHSWACKVSFVSSAGVSSAFSELSNRVHQVTDALLSHGNLKILPPPAPLLVRRKDGSLEVHLASSQGRSGHNPLSLVQVQMKFDAIKNACYYIKHTSHRGFVITSAPTWVEMDDYPNYCNMIRVCTPSGPCRAKIRYSVGMSESAFSLESTAVFADTTDETQSSEDVIITKVVTQQDRDKEGFANAILVDDSDSEMETFPNPSDPASGLASGPSNEPRPLNVTCSVCKQKGHTRRSKACPGRPVAVAVAAAAQAPVANLQTVPACAWPTPR